MLVANPLTSIMEKYLLALPNISWGIKVPVFENQYSCLENLMDGGAWWAAVHGVTKSRTRLSVFAFTFHFHALEKAMATHSSVLAWRIPGTEETGGLPSMGSQRVGHDWSDLTAAAADSPSQTVFGLWHKYTLCLYIYSFIYSVHLLSTWYLCWVLGCKDSVVNENHYFMEFPFCHLESH